MLYNAALTGWGHYAPSNVVTNDDLAQTVDTSDEWIQSRSGIKERRFAEAHEHTSTMSVEASRMALERAGIEGRDLDLILVATSSPDYLTPPVSSQVQDLLGAEKAGAMALVVGCTGFVYGLVTAAQFIATGAAKNVLVVGAELISRNLNMQDRSTCVLFGDGAGAVVLQATEEPCGLRSHVLGSDGSGHEAIIQWSGGSRNPVNHERIDQNRQMLHMNGREVFKFATRTMVESLQEVMDDAGITKDDVDLFIPHQANQRIIEYAAHQLELPPEKVVLNVDRYGNTSAATIPIALSEALEAGRTKPGDTLAMVGFGAGLTWAAAIFDLAPKTVTPVSRINGQGAVMGDIA
jgi:3-oxoacyl-[acyl-carrier-protein] synthase-3